MSGTLAITALAAGVAHECYYEDAVGTPVSVVCGGDPAVCDLWIREDASPVPLDGSLVAFTIPAGVSDLICHHVAVGTYDVLQISQLQVSSSGTGGNCDDGDACTENDACGAAGCEGTPVVCNDGDPCTEDACAAGTGCVYTDGNGLPCDDGNACTTGDLCANGACSGATLACDDGEFCTSDSCDPATGCVFCQCGRDGL